MSRKTTIIRWAGLVAPALGFILCAAVPVVGAPARSQAATAATPLAKAQAAAQQGRYAEAETLARQWLKTHPQDTDALFLLARVLAWQGKLGESGGLFDRLLQRSPSDADYLLGKAQVLVRAGKPERALPLLGKARTVAPRYEDVYRLEVQTLSRLGKKDALGQLLPRAQKIFPRTNWAALAAEAPGAPVAPIPRSTAPQPEGPLAAAQAAAGKGDLAGAEKLLRQRLATAPTDSEARFLLARVLAWQRKAEDAVTEYSRLLAVSPGNIDYLAGKAQALIWADKPADALRVLDQALAVSPRYEELHRLRIQALRQSGDAQALAQAQAEAQRLFPDASWAGAPATREAGLVEQARQAITQKDLYQAERLLRDCVRVSPGDETARFLLARVLGWQGKAGDAVAEYDRLLRDAPQNADYLVGEAQALLWANKPVEALPLLQAAKGVSPKYEEAYWLELQALARAGEAEQLDKAQKEALRLFPGAAWAQPAAAGVAQALAQARVAVRERRLDEAERLLSEWLKTNDKDEDARSLLARVLSWEGKSTEALAQYDQLLAMQPDAADYLVGKAQILILTRKAGDAVPLLKKVITASPRYEDAYRLLLQALAAAGDRAELETVRAEAIRNFPESEWPELTPQALPEVPVLAVKPTPEEIQQWSAIQQAVDAGDGEKATALLAAWLQRYPRDDRARFALAKVFTWQGRPDDALKELDVLLDHDPRNTDALLIKGQALLRAGRPADAVAPLEEARKLAPSYEDVTIALAQAYQRQGDREKLDALRAEAEATFPNAPWLARLAPAAAVAAGPEAAPREAGVPLSNRVRLLEVAMGYSLEAVTNGRGDWRTLSVEGKSDLGSGQTFVVNLNETERFRLSDQSLGGTYVRRLNDDWNATVEASYSPTHRVLPIWSLSLEGQRKLPGGWLGSAGVRHTEYSSSDANQLTLTGERYWGAFRGAYILALGRASGAGTAVGQRLRLDRYYGEKSFIGIEGALGRELDSLGAGQVVHTAVLALRLSGRHWVRPTWAVDYGLGWHRQGDLYRRTGLSLGVRNTF